MISKTFYQTFDGLHHNTRKDADNHLEKLYSAQITKVGIALSRCDGKYSSFCTHVDSNLDDFIYLEKIRQDHTLFNEDDF